MKIRVNFIKAGTASIFGADMSVLVWVSLPKLRLTQLIEKMTNSLARKATKGSGGFFGRMLSDDGKYRLMGAAPILASPAHHGAAFSHRHAPMHEGKILQ